MPVMPLVAMPSSVQTWLIHRSILQRGAPAAELISWKPIFPLDRTLRAFPSVTGGVGEKGQRCVSSLWFPTPSLGFLISVMGGRDGEMVPVAPSTEEELWHGDRESWHALRCLLCLHYPLEPL